MANDTLIVREATADDSATLLAWRNDPDTRAASVSSDPVSQEQHERWLAERLSRDAPNLYIAERAGVPVATFRIDGDRLSYTVAPDHRGEGLGKALLATVREAFGPLVTEIKSSNLASIRAARSAGHRIVILD